VGEEVTDCKSFVRRFFHTKVSDQKPVQFLIGRQ
jgi:hypothetical protein